MTFTWDTNVVAAAMAGITIAGQVVLFIVFLVKSNGRSISAHKLAEKANARAEEAHVSIAAQQGALSMFREQVAREYVDRDALREMEDRLTDTLKAIQERLDWALDRRPK